MNTTYDEMRIIYKYLYNEMNYFKFKELLIKAFPHSNDNYVAEKWVVFQRDIMGFLSTYDRLFFQAVIDEINVNNYKG